jgi:hypothetical protein
MGARLAALLKKEEKGNPIVRVRPGVFGLRDWKEKRGKQAEVAVAQQDSADDDAAAVNALEVEAATAAEAEPDPDFAEDDEEARPALSEDDALRANLAASGPDSEPAPAAGATAADGEGGRRRRRRRRRGRGAGREGDFVERASGPRLEGAEAGDAAVDPITGERGRAEGHARPVVRERHQILAVPNDVPLAEGDELAGRELADAAVLVLGSFDKSQGTVPVRSVAEAMARKGRLTGDPGLAASALVASLRADNLRREALGLRPRFRFASQGRVGLTDWHLGGDVVRLEQEALFAIEKFKEATRRSMQRKLQELPGSGFVELALLALERMGMLGLRPVRRQGSPGGEAHFAGTHRTGVDEIRTAIVIRKDGRELGRERVSDLRGSLHHYGDATAGWLITSGQVLSGAREEATLPGTSPIALYDGLSFARLLEENGVGYHRTQVHIGIPDMELLEALRGA